MRRHLPNHSVFTAFELGWSELSNGELLAAAETRFVLCYLLFAILCSLSSVICDAFRPLFAICYFVDHGQPMSYS
jgi:hypothetical protein